MTKSSLVLQYWKLGFDIWRMSVEAQAIMTMRLTGMAGFWTPARGETTRMVREKQEAFADAIIRAGVKALQGQPPDQVMRAALDPVRRKTSGNSRRLGKSIRRQMF